MRACEAPEGHADSIGRNLAALVGLLIAPLGVLFTFVQAIPQDPAYHALADQHALFGVPGFANVASNVGLLLKKRKPLPA